MRDIMKIDRRSLLRAGLSFGFVQSSNAFAQSSYPNRPIRLIVPYPAGGGTDFFARLVGASMAQALGQPIVIENRAGAGTNIGAEAAARSAPDGYTFLLGDLATYAANPSLYIKLPYDPQKDFTPISLTGRFAIVLLVNTQKLPVASVAELVEVAKKEPGSIDYASGGIGNPFHLASELIAHTAGIKLNHIPYRGAAPALQDLAGGQVGMMFVDFATARSQLTNPKLKALAVAAPAELAELPNVPPLASSGYPGFEVWAWQGFVAPAGTSPEIIEKLRESYLKAISDDEIKRKILEAGIEVLQSTPAQFAEYMSAEAKRWDVIIKTAKIRAD